MDTKQANQKFVRKRTGKLVDYYRVGKELGSGAYGSVRRIVHIETGEKRAVKVIEKHTMNKEEIDTLYNEINVLRNLDHPNIVKIYEYFEDEKRFFIVTELCKGGELFDHIISSGGHLSEEAASQIMRHVLSCVNYCHQNKIVHRDLKPENILLESDPKAYDELKIIDFGTSKYYNPETAAETGDSSGPRQEQSSLKEIIGTPYYIAPEVLKMNYGSKCDVWSCGIVAFMLLSGTIPIRGSNPREIMRNVVKGDWTFYAPIWETISDEAKDFVTRLMTYEADRRPTAHEILQHKWIRKYNQPGVTKEQVDQALRNMARYEPTRCKLKHTVLEFIVHQIMQKDAKRELSKVFTVLNTRCDGKLCGPGLAEGYATHFGADPEIEALCSAGFERAATRVDGSRSEHLSYSQFIMASANHSQAVATNHNLNLAF